MTMDDLQQLLAIVYSCPRCREVTVLRTVDGFRCLADGCGQVLATLPRGTMAWWVERDRLTPAARAVSLDLKGLTMPSDDLRERIESLRQLRDAASPLPMSTGLVEEDGPPIACYAVGRRHNGPDALDRATCDADYMMHAANLAPALADEVERLRAALLVLANWQVERRPGGSGEMCDFADDALKGATRDE